MRETNRKDIDARPRDITALPDPVVELISTITCGLKNIW